MTDHPVLWLIVAVGVIATVICIFRHGKVREGMAYLDQYEKQDNFRNVPSSWPVVDTTTTALFTVRRDMLEKERKMYQSGHSIGFIPEGI